MKKMCPRVHIQDKRGNFVVVVAYNNNSLAIKFMEKMNNIFNFSFLHPMLYIYWGPFDCTILYKSRTHVLGIQDGSFHCHRHGNVPA